MSDQRKPSARRRTLVRLTAAAGGVAAAGAAVPFLASLAPSEQPAARIRAERYPLDRAGAARHGGAVHAPGLHSNLLSRARLGAAGLARRLYCPCHGSKFDLAGRVYRGSPAPTNLEIPPHRYLSPEVVLIGGDGTA